jgi:hypothetical protein
VRNSANALRRVAEYRLPLALDQQMLELSERKEHLSPEEHARLLALVDFSQERTIEKLNAELALRQLSELFPDEAGP